MEYLHVMEWRNYNRDCSSFIKHLVTVFIMLVFRLQMFSEIFLGLMIFTKILSA